MPQKTRQERIAGQLERHLDRISPANAAYCRRAVQLRRNKGNRDSSTYSFLVVASQLDEAADKPFAELTPDELSDVLAAWRQRKSGTTLAQNALYLRTIMRDVLDVDSLPRAYKAVLDVREPPRRIRGLVVPDEQFHDLLAGIEVLAGAKSGPGLTAMQTALVWLLRDVGLRAREALSLNWSDIRIADGGAYITLRHDAPDLKTGPRAVFGIRCVRRIEAWQRLHPAGNDPRAPVWIGPRDATGYNRLAYKELYKLLCRAGEAAGIAPVAQWPEPLGAHDLRHTCATEKGRLNWSEEKMRVYFGWAPGSDMPSHYVRLTMADLRNQVLRDARNPEFESDKSSRRKGAAMTTR